MNLIFECIERSCFITTAAKKLKLWDKAMTFLGKIKKKILFCDFFYQIRTNFLKNKRKSKKKMFKKLLTLFFFFFLSQLSFQNPSVNKTRNHHLTKSYYFYVFGSLQNSNAIPLSNITIILTFPDWNRTFSYFSDSEGKFNISDILPNTTIILVGQIYFIDSEGLYAEKSLELTLYLGNAYTMDFGNITLLRSSPNLINISVIGYIYSNSKPIANAFILIQPEIAQTSNTSNVSLPLILNSNGTVADSVNVSSLNQTFLAKDNITSIITSDKNGSFQFFLSNASLKIEYHVKLLAMKRYYHDVETEIKLVNMSETSLLMNMTSLITQGNISGRIIDQFSTPILDVDLMCNCSGGYKYIKNGLEISADGYFYFIVRNISMIRAKVFCNLTFQSKGFSSKHLKNVTLYRSNNYTKNLNNVSMKHEDVKAFVHGNVHNKYGEPLDGILATLVVYNLETQNNKSQNISNNLLMINGTTDQNGSFELNFTMILYSKVNCTLNLSGYAYEGSTKIFELNELNNYAKYFKNLTLKIERVRAKILGVLFDQIFNQTLSGLEVTIYSQITNKSYYSLTNEDGVFKYYFSN